MTLIDSTAAFEKRCDELRAGLKDVFSASFVTTFSELAFAVGTPQSPVSDAVMQRFADNLFGGPCTIGDCAVIKRIHFEAITLVIIGRPKAAGHKWRRVGASEKTPLR